MIDVDDVVAQDASSKTHPADADDVNLLFGSIILYYIMYTSHIIRIRQECSPATGPSVTCPRWDDNDVIIIGVCVCV